jgi:polyisoprenoid-binding protein YceI
LQYQKSNWLGQRFRIKKVDSFWPIEPLFEFDAGHRTKKVVKSGRKVAFFDRNGSDLTSYKNNFNDKITMSNTKWVLDPTHSEVQFKVKHLMITNVTGQFKVLSAEAQTTDQGFDHTQVAFSIDVNSIDTGNEQRDGHLRSGDFFDAEKYPAIAFNSTGYNASTGKIKGDLTVRDVTKPVEFDVEFSGTNKDPWGNEKAGFSINGKINRNDFGLTWNAALESGGVLVSEDVKLQAEIQFVKQA